MDLAKAYLEAEDGAKLEFHFNPTTISFSKRANFQEQQSSAARSAPSQQFTGTGPTELSLKILLDDVEDVTGAIPGEVDKLLKWTNPQDPDASNPKPPKLTFTWGALKFGDGKKFEGRLHDARVTYQLFQRDGTPLRAEATIKLKADPDEPQGTNPTSGGLTPYRSHEVARGETLQSVAFNAYGSARRWRDIAVENGIDNPLRVLPGAKLLLPASAELSGRA